MPDPADPISALEARISELDAQIAKLTAERDRCSHALSTLTDGCHPVNLGNMTPAQRRNVALGKKKTGQATKDFAAAISTPHAGGPGYSIRSLAEVLVGEGFSASRGTFTAVFQGRFKVSKALDNRVFELTGYRFPAKYVRSE